MAGQITRVSTDANGNQAAVGQVSFGQTGGFSGNVRFSPAGRKVVFVSEAGNLVPGNTN